MKKAAMLMALALACSGIPRAQIGSGWVEYFPTKSLQQENSQGYSTYTDVDGVETFTLRKNPSGARQRCEIRVEDNYTSGVTQFQGEFQMVKGGGSGISIMQVWLSVIIPVSEQDNGSITWWKTRLIDGIYGRWIKLNVYHSADARVCEIWFDGVRKGVHEVKNSNPYYHKYGLYNEAESNPEIKWRNVHYFKGGKMDGVSGAINLPTLKKNAAGRFLLVRDWTPMIAVGSSYYDSKGIALP